MENNNFSSIRAIGCVDELLGPESSFARVKVLALYDSNDKIRKLSDGDAHAEIPSEGYAIWRNYFKYKEEISLGDFITFTCQFDETEVRSDKYFVVSPKRHKIKIYHGRSAIIKEDRSFNFHELNKEFSNGNIDGDFSILVDGKLFGIMRFNNHGLVESKSGKVIGAWYNIEDEIVSHNGRSSLIKDKLSDRDDELDFMDNKQLVGWFRDKIKELNIDLYKSIGAAWMDQLRLVFNELEASSNSIDVARIKKLTKYFSAWELSIQEVNFFSEANAEFRNVFQQAVERQKEEFKALYQQELTEWQQLILSERRQYEKDRIDREKEIADREDQLLKLKRELFDLEGQILHVKDNKARLLHDFKLLLEVTSKSIDNNGIGYQNQGFLLEKIERSPSENNLFVDFNLFVKRLNYYLFEAGTSVRMARHYANVFVAYDCILMPSLAVTLPLLKAVGNTRYVIQQAEVNWIRFEQLWTGGLEALWRSCFSHPDVIHIFVIEDINMASVECYGKPLLDVMRGLRQHIPYGNLPKPKNLKIVGTVMPHKSTKIGLPLYEQTYSGWGCVGFEHNKPTQLSDAPTFEEGYVDVSCLELFMGQIDSERDEMLIDVSKELELAFSL